MDTPPTIPEPNDPRWYKGAPSEQKDEPPGWFKAVVIVILLLIVLVFILPVSIWLTRTLWGLAL